METLILVLHREGLPGELIPKLLLRPEEWQSNGAQLKLTQTGNGKPICTLANFILSVTSQLSTGKGKLLQKTSTQRSSENRLLFVRLIWSGNGLLGCKTTCTFQESRRVEIMIWMVKTIMKTVPQLLFFFKSICLLKHWGINIWFLIYGK